MPALTFSTPLPCNQQSDTEEKPKNVVDVDEEDDSDEDVSSANEGISRIARGRRASRVRVCVWCVARCGRTGQGNGG